ncbi:MAG: acyltransferase [Parvularculaceae bacterium]
MTESHNAYLARKHFAGLDGLRALAIIAVVWHHSAHPDFLPMFSRGFAGVDLFFVLSGFLIATLLLREKARFGKISLKNFWARRFLRLMPAYYLLLFGMLGAYLVFKPGDPDTQRLVEGFPVYALYLSNWIHPDANNLGITWSLATEEQFYLVWPLIEAFAAPFIALWFWIVALVVNQLINFGVLDPALQNLFGLAPDHHPEILQATFTPILMGVGLAHALNRRQGFSILTKAAGFKYAPAVFGLVLVGLFNVPAADISGALRLSIHIAMTLWIASIILAPASGTAKFLDWRPVAFIGAVSYGMYLYHMWAIHIVRTLLGKLGIAQDILQFPLALALTVAISAASFYFFEKRFLNLRARFRK